MRSARLTRVMATGAAALLAGAGLVACSSGSEDSGGPSGTADQAEGATGNDASSGATVKIGFFSPQSGIQASDGKSALDAAKLAVEHINASGGLAGAEIDLVNYDDGSDPKQAVSIATKLTTQDKVAAVVSGSYSDQTLAAASVFQRAGVPMLAAYAVNPGIPGTGDEIFQIATSGPVEGRAGAVALVSELGAKNIAIVAIDNDFGNALVKGFTAKAEELGAKIVSTDFNQFGEKNFGPVIKNAVDAGADGFYMVEYSAEGQQFLTAYRQRDLDQHIVATEGIDSTQQFIEPNAELAEGMVFTTVLNRDSENETTQKFLSDFQEKYGHAADMVAATTYDAFMVLQAAAKNGTNADALKAGITSLTDFRGATGTIEKFADRISVHRITLQIFQGGEVHYFGTVDDASVITP